MNICEAQQNHIQNIKSNKISSWEFILLMASLMALNSLAIDVVLPAFDLINQSLPMKNSNDQHYIIFMYLLGFGLAQIFFGFISDRYGRKKPLLCGLAIYSISSLLCIIAPSFSWLLFFRLLQGGGAAATNVLTLSIIRDLYRGSHMASTMSLIFLVFIMVPVTAPAIGQFLLLFGNWPIIFYFMACAGLLTILWVQTRLPETLFASRSINVKTILDSVKTILTTKEAVFYSLASASLFGGLYAMLNTAKQIYVDIFQLGKYFPLAFASVAIAQAISSILNSKLVQRLGMRTISHTVLLVYITAAFLLSLITWWHSGHINFFLFIALLFVIMFSYGVVGANFNSLAMERLGNIAGAAASLIGFAQITISSLVGLFISQQFNGTILPIAFGFLGVSLIALGLILCAENGKLFD